MKKKFKNFLKQLGDSPKKKRNISANVHASSEVSPPPYKDYKRVAKFGPREIDTPLKNTKASISRARYALLSDVKKSLPP